MIRVNGEEIKINYFPDGTQLLKQRPSEIARIDWFYENDEELTTLIFITCHLRKIGCLKIELFMPYIPNARYDRVKSDEEVFTLKHFAEVINWLLFDEVTILDPHSYVSEALIDNIVVESPKQYINYFIDNHFLGAISLNKFALFYPDEGSMKRYSGMFKMPYTFGLKKRDWETGDIMGLDVVGDENYIKDRIILIVDDICSRGGTFYHSAKKLKELGAKKVYLYVTHCENTILKGDLLTSGLIDKVFTTNSIFTKEHELIEVYDLKGE